jgi:spermidine synthase
MRQRAAAAGVLLFASGFCSLTYETVWLRQFRLIFGGTTAATAAVLAIFMGGLGLGSIVIGRRAEASRNPLALYGRLEIGVAISAALSPLLLVAARWLYLATGGSFAIGLFAATLVRLLLATMVIGAPAVLMGGTLPAAARAAEGEEDERRFGVALLYAMNTLGAVAGALVSTFFLIERFGNRNALFAAALLNAFAGLAAILISNNLRSSRHGIITRSEIGEEEPEVVDAPAAAPRLVFIAAAVTGFAFLLLEIIWYRMLTPLLGGTTYTFGLILALALAGVGCGSVTYTLLFRSRATASGFALCCALEAFFVALPIALGDRIALFALVLRPVASLGFAGTVLGWTLVTSIVVIPPAFFAGLQFPLLISLLGTGRKRVADQVGRAYAWNTAGAIAGSLAGGFGLLPLLTAPIAWRAVAALLVVLAIAMVVERGRPLERRRFLIATSLGVAIASVAMLFATGPTAFWRHTPIGAGRADQVLVRPNVLRDIEANRRRGIVWQAEGVESSVAIDDSDGYAFLVNGKGDGHARLDAGTQVMCGALAGLLHPHPRTAAVVGLGTGSTAGWLAAMPSMQRVDVVEIERSVLHVAAECAAVNHDVLHNPKVHIEIGDGREFLLTTRKRFDVISAEPPNPARAGVATLFTTEFYRACAGRLERGGMLIQFLQAYEADAPAVSAVYAALHEVFPHVETWQSQSGDLLLVASSEPLQYDEGSIRQRLAIAPVGEAAARVWWAFDASTVLAHYVGGNETTVALASSALPNTDDRTSVEFSFARTLGRGDSFRVTDLREFAATRNDALPSSVAPPAAEAINRRRMSLAVVQSAPADMAHVREYQLQLRGSMQNAYVSGNYEQAWVVLQAIGSPETPLEGVTAAEVLANRGDERAQPLIDKLRIIAPIEADVIAARLLWRRAKPDEAIRTIARALTAYRTNPWPLPVTMRRALEVVAGLAEETDAHGLAVLREAIAHPFAVHMLENSRKLLAYEIESAAAGQGRCTPELIAAIHAVEPNVPWQREFLQRRAACYEAMRDPLAVRAKADAASFLEAEPRPLQ